MSRQQSVVALMVMAVILAATVCAQDTAFQMPDGWVVSPENDRAENEAGYRILHETTGMEMVYVPGGSFMMGSEDGEDTEQPVHRVELDGFWIGRTEVTVGQWRSVMDSVPEYNAEGDDHPVVHVSWHEAQEFCEKVGLELPTEAQWEYAARGPEAKEYPWGDEWYASRCQSVGDRHGRKRTAPVGSFKEGASWCGALDMAGNVFEWCLDSYDSDFYSSGEAGERNPVCSDELSPARVLRGGGWRLGTDFCRSASRFRFFPALRSHFWGVRVSRAR